MKYRTNLWRSRNLSTRRSNKNVTGNIFYATYGVRTPWKERLRHPWAGVNCVSPYNLKGYREGAEIYG